MSQGEVQIWALAIGLLVFAAVVGVIYARRRASERASGRSADNEEHDIWTGAPIAPPGDVTVISTSTGGWSSGRRRPAPSPVSGSPDELASGVRSLVLRAVAERAPTGWSALILCPPPHPEQMAWHVHLTPEIALDLKDGRTVSVAAPLASHEWHLPGGRTVGVGDGDPEPPPSDETVALRITGPYLVVAVSRPVGKLPEMTARVMTVGDEALPQPRAATTDIRAMQAALREAVELAVGSRMLGAPPAVGYRRSSWDGHERVWLTMGR